MGLGFVLAFADGAASGLSTAWMRARARREEGMRAAKVGRWDVTCGAKGDGEGRGRRIVNGPGQKRAMRGW